MISAESVYICVLLLLAMIVLWAGAVDVVFFLRGEQTISAWLRGHTGWFFVPLSVSMLLIAFLIMHLFVWHE
jgi:hypothetical protein